MSRFRLFMLAMASFLAVVGESFFKKSIAVGLCGILTFNSASCWGNGVSAAIANQGELSSDRTEIAIPPRIRPAEAYVGDSLANDFTIVSQNPYGSGRNKILFTSPSTGVEQVYSINLPGTGAFQLYETEFSKVNVGDTSRFIENRENVLLSAAEIQAKLENFTIRFDNNTPAAVILADGTTATFAPSQTVIKTPEGEVIETIPASQANYPSSNVASKANYPYRNQNHNSRNLRYASNQGNCEDKVIKDLINVSDYIKNQSSKLNTNRSQYGYLVSWALTFGYKALQDSTIQNSRNLSIRKLACQPPVKCGQAQDSGGNEVVTSLVELKGITNRKVSINYEFYSVPDRLELYYEGKLIQSVPEGSGFTSGNGVVVLDKDKIPDGAQYLGIKLIGNPDEVTKWNYTMSCSGQEVTSEVATVTGVYELIESDIPGCEVGTYPIKGSFDSGFTTFTLLEAEGAQGCFRELPQRLFQLSQGLVNNGEPLVYETDDIAGSISSPRIVGQIARVKGSLGNNHSGLFDGGFVYPETKNTYGILSLNELQLVNDVLIKYPDSKNKIDGAKNSLAVDNLPDIDLIPDEFPESEIIEEFGLEEVRTALDVMLSDDATVGQVNGALAAVGGRIINSIPGLPGIEIAIPDIGTVEGIERAERVLAALPGIDFTSRVFVYGVPELGEEEEEVVSNQFSLTNLFSRKSGNTKQNNPEDIPPLCRENNIPGEIIPVPILLSQAVDLCGDPPKEIKKENLSKIKIIVADLFNIFKQNRNKDVKLNLSGSNVNTDHGYMVSGLLGAIRGNQDGVIGTFPYLADSPEEIVGMSGWKLEIRTLFEKIKTHKKDNNKIVVNVSRNTPDYHKNSLDKSQEENTGIPWAGSIAFWRAQIRYLSKDIEDDLIIVASAGNKDISLYADQNSIVAGAGLDQDNNLDNDLLEKHARQTCKDSFKWFQKFLKSISGIDNYCSKKLTFKEIKKPLQNTLVVGNINANTGEYATSSSRERNQQKLVRAVGEVEKASLEPLTGDTDCKKISYLSVGDETKCRKGVGTSGAAPQVAGLAAYIWNQKPEMSAREIVERIKLGERKFPTLDETTGKFTGDLSKKTIINVKQTLNDLDIPIETLRQTTQDLEQPGIEFIQEIRRVAPDLIQ